MGPLEATAVEHWACSRRNKSLRSRAPINSHILTVKVKSNLPKPASSSVASVSMLELILIDPLAMLRSGRHGRLPCWLCLTAKTTVCFMSPSAKPYGLGRKYTADPGQTRRGVPYQQCQNSFSVGGTRPQSGFSRKVVFLGLCRKGNITCCQRAE